MWSDLFHQPIVLNEEAFIAHYNKCLRAVFERVLAKVAASGLQPDEFLTLHSQQIVAEVQGIKTSFMQMLHFTDEGQTDEFGVKLSRIMLNQLHDFTHASFKKGMVPGYN